MTDPIVMLPGLSIARVAAESQWLLHAEPADADAFASAAGLSLPTTMLTGETAEGWTALHLSLDEWLLLSDDRAGTALAEPVEASGIACSLVDVSDRTLAVEIEGPLAMDTLAGGCPLDLERVADGCCTRTLLGKVTVLLRRQGERWRIDCARSLDGYITELLRVCARDAVEAAASA